MMKMDDDTLRWMRDDARETQLRGVVLLAGQALDGDEEARRRCLASLQFRVAQAHRAHCRRGQASRLEGM